MWILELQNLSKTYRSIGLKREALRSLSCRFRSGRCTGLLGHNGAGKTTALRTILGLIQPDRGSVLFEGRPMTSGDRKSIGFMPELSAFPRALSCSEVLLHQLRLMRPEWRDYEQRVQNVLTQVGLPSCHHLRVSQLSKGMHRRLNFAHAIIHEPKLLILDEPFSGLDPVARYELVEVTRRIKDTSVILCTHELWTIQAMCDDLHIFRQGQLAYSTVDPLSDQVRNLLAARMNLRFSGITVEDLKSVPLKSPEQVSTRGKTLELSFDHYPDALEWLRNLLDRGAVLISAGDDVTVDDTFVYNLFKGGHG